MHVSSWDASEANGFAAGSSPLEDEEASTFRPSEYLLRLDKTRSEDGARECAHEHFVAQPPEPSQIG